MPALAYSAPLETITLNYFLVLLVRLWTYDTIMLHICNVSLFHQGLGYMWQKSNAARSQYHIVLLKMDKERLLVLLT